MITTLMKRKEILKELITQREKEICEMREELKGWKDELDEINQELEVNQDNNREELSRNVEEENNEIMENNRETTVEYLDSNQNMDEISEEEMMEDNGKSERQRKRKNMEKFVKQKESEKTRKRRKFTRFQEELMEETDTEETQEDIEEKSLEDLEKEVEKKELVKLFLKACNKEMEKVKLNRKIINYWYKYAERFKEIVEEIQNEDSSISERTAVKIVYQEINLEILGWDREKLKKKTEGARKIYYLFLKIGKTKIKKIKEKSNNTILNDN